MSGDLTIVYYTSNREAPAFERKIADRLVAAARGRPVISVSQKPMALGKNICVGDVGCSDANAFRQLLIGCREAKTRYVAVAESDCLYPPEYFEFTPPDETNCWRYAWVYILFWRPWKGDGGFRRKEFTEGAQVVSRNLLIRNLESALRGWPEWSVPGDGVPRGPKPAFAKRTWEYFGTADRPMVSVKTGNGLRASTGTVKDERHPDSLPYWGPADALRRELFDGR